MVPPYIGPEFFANGDFQPNGTPRDGFYMLGGTSVVGIFVGTGFAAREFLEGAEGSPGVPLTVAVACAGLLKASAALLEWYDKRHPPV